MRRLILGLILSLSISIQTYGQERPKWVTGIVGSEFYYTGVASATKDEANYRELASQRALSAIVSQISVSVSSESLLYTIEKNGSISSIYEEAIKINASEQIEGYKVVDTWQNEVEYWVYYELSRSEYDRYVKERRERLMALALDFWIKGNSAISSGGIASAATLYSNGLETLIPVINEDLRCSYNGKIINIASEIYNSLATLWSDVTLASNPTSVEVELLKGAKDGIAIGCYKNGVALKGVNLTAKFTSGEGSLSSLIPTDNNGVSGLYITSITSKSPSQQINISISDDNIKNNSALCKAIFATINLPSINIELTLSQSRITAYFEEDNMAITSLSNNISTMISNGYFDIVNSPDSADLIIKLGSTFASGREVSGDLYNTREYAGSLTLDIIDNRTQASLGRYNVDRTTALLPLDRSIEQAKQSVGREILKRVNRELPRILAQIRVDTSSPIPPRVTPQASPTPTPAPVPAPAPTLPVVTPQPVVDTPTAVEIKGALEQDVWITYKGMTHINDTTNIELIIYNGRNQEYVFNKYINTNIKAYNHKGESVKVRRIDVAGNDSSFHIVSTIVSEIPTKMVITIDRVEAISLLQISDLKLRALK